MGDSGLDGRRLPVHGGGKKGDVWFHKRGENQSRIKVNARQALDNRRSVGPEKETKASQRDRSTREEVVGVGWKHVYLPVCLAHGSWGERRQTVEGAIWVGPCRPPGRVKIYKEENCKRGGGGGGGGEGGEKRGIVPFSQIPRIFLGEKNNTEGLEKHQRGRGRNWGGERVLGYSASIPVSVIRGKRGSPRGNTTN